MPIQDGLVRLVRRFDLPKTPNYLLRFSSPGKTHNQLFIGGDSRKKSPFDETRFTFHRERQLLTLSGYAPEEEAVLGIRYQTGSLIELAVSVPLTDIPPKQTGLTPPFSRLLSPASRIFPPRFLVSQGMKNATRATKTDLPHPTFVTVYQSTSTAEVFFGGGEDMRKWGYQAERQDDTLLITLPGRKNPIRVPAQLG